MTSPVKTSGCNPCTWETEAGALEGKGHFQLHSKVRPESDTRDPVSNCNNNLSSASNYHHVYNPCILSWQMGPVPTGKKPEVSFKDWVQIQSTLSQPGPLHKLSSFSEVPEALGVKQGCCQSAGKFFASENVCALPLYSTSSCLCAPAVSGLKQLRLDDFTSSHKRASWQKASAACS